MPYPNCDHVLKVFRIIVSSVHIRVCATWEIRMSSMQRVSMPLDLGDGAEVSKVSYGEGEMTQQIPWDSMWRRIWEWYFEADISNWRKKSPKLDGKILLGVGEHNQKWKGVKKILVNTINCFGKCRGNRVAVGNGGVCWGCACILFWA